MLIASVVVFGLLLLAACALTLVYRLRKFRGLGALSLYIFAGSLAILIFLFGPWLYLSVYLKYIFAACIITLSARGAISKGQRQPISKKRAIFVFLLSVPLLLLNTIYFTGTTGTPVGTINLNLPFHKGVYLVQQGGRGLPGNIFHSFGRGTPYAIDIVKLNKVGNRAARIFSSQLNDYEIFEDTVFCPCKGRVMKIENNNPDNLPPERKRGPTNTNQVLIETNNSYVFLCHFKQGSVMVKPGDLVETGTPLALVGNSGYSLEPHLHIQAHLKKGKHQAWYNCEQLLITFNGSEYRLFEQIAAEQ